MAAMEREVKAGSRPFYARIVVGTPRSERADRWSRSRNAIRWPSLLIVVVNSRLFGM